MVTLPSIQTLLPGYVLGRDEVAGQSSPIGLIETDPFLAPLLEKFHIPAVAHAFASFGCLQVEKSRRLRVAFSPDSQAAIKVDTDGAFPRVAALVVDASDGVDALVAHVRVGTLLAS